MTKYKDLLFLKPLPHINKQEKSCYMELLSLYKEHDLCNVQYITQIQPHNFFDTTMIPESRCWVHSIGDVLLYNNTKLDKLSGYPFKFGLFANEILKAPNASPWIFWPRKPLEFYKFLNDHNYLDYNDRLIESIFIGTETIDKRGQGWENSTSFFDLLPLHYNHLQRMKYSYHKYLNLISRSRFGLSLPGVGPKTLRTIEYLGVGTIPILTPGCHYDFYDPIIEGKHYLFADSPDKVSQIIVDTPKEKWQYISEEGKKWFKRNASLYGSFDTTIEILEKHNLI